MDDEKLTDYADDGVDLTLVRWFLSLTPAERLEYIEQHSNGVLAVWERNDRKQIR
jgi:hypothetical protein